MQRLYLLLGVGLRAVGPGPDGERGRKSQQDALERGVHLGRDNLEAVPKGEAPVRLDAGLSPQSFSELQQLHAGPQDQVERKGTAKCGQGNAKVAGVGGE